MYLTNEELDKLIKNRWEAKSVDNTYYALKELQSKREAEDTLHTMVLCTCGCGKGDRLKYMVPAEKDGFFYRQECASKIIKQLSNKQRYVKTKEIIKVFGPDDLTKDICIDLEKVIYFGPKENYTNVIFSDGTNKLINMPYSEFYNYFRHVS